MDRVWRLPHRIDLDRISAVAADVAKPQPAIEVEIEQESDDTITAFFSATDQGRELVFEVSIYDCGGDGVLLSLEEDAGDNFGYWDDASFLAEEMADALGGTPVEL